MRDSAPLVSRRSLLTGSAAAVGAAVLGRQALGQFDSTPPAAPIPQAASDPIADLAAALDYDHHAIFDFVRDEIAYESYAGVLRGAKGTLFARAGNSADQAMLLGALYQASQIPYRFAFGELDAINVERLAESLATSPETMRSAFDTAVAAGLPGRAATPVADQAADRSAWDDANAQLATMRETVESGADALVSAITGVLSAGSIVLPDLPSPQIHAQEQSGHAWIQVPDGPSWVDLDPSLPATDSPITASTTADTLPPELEHIIELHLTVEEVYGGIPSQREVLTWRQSSHTLVDVPIALAFTGPESLRDTGVAITSGIEGTISFAPCLLAGESFVAASTPFVFGAGGGVLGALDSGTGEVADGETTAVWLTVDITSPGETPVHIERTFLDRIGLEARASGVFDVATLAPITKIDDANGRPTIPELSGFSIISTEVSREPISHTLADAATLETYGRLNLIGPSIASLRTALRFERGADSGFDAYPTSPGLTAVTVSTVLDASETPTFQVVVDLLHQAPGVFALPNPSLDATEARVLVSVLDQATEQAMVQAMLSPDTAGPTALLPTVGDVFSEAATAGIDLALVQTDAEIGALDIDPEAKARLKSSIALGLVAVVPASEVTIGDRPAIGWWLIDPVSGRLFDQMADGRSFGGGNRGFGPGVRFQGGGYAALLNNIRTWAGPYLLLGKCIAFVAAQASLASDYSNSKDAVDAFIETFKNVNPQDAKGCLG